MGLASGRGSGGDRRQCAGRAADHVRRRRPPYCGFWSGLERGICLRRLREPESLLMLIPAALPLTGLPHAIPWCVVPGVLVMSTTTPAGSCGLHGGRWTVGGRRGGTRGTARIGWFRSTLPDGASWRYTYDPAGRRISKERVGDAAGRTVFVWDGARLAESHTSASDGSVIILTWDYDPGTHRPAAQRRHTWATADADQEADRRGLPRHRHRPRGNAHRTGHPGRPHRLADHHHGMGPNHGDDRRPTTSTARCASPGSTTTPKPACTTTCTATTPRKPAPT